MVRLEDLRYHFEYHKTVVNSKSVFKHAAGPNVLRILGDLMKFGQFFKKKTKKTLFNTFGPAACLNTLFEFTAVLWYSKWHLRSPNLTMNV